MNIKGIQLKIPMLCFVCVLGALMIAGTSYARDTFKTIPGAKGKLCLKCHEKFKKAVKNRYVHPLMKNGECTGCHEPHASSYKDLLTAAPAKLCYNCHKKVLPEKAASAHEVVKEGKCNKCHSSHGSNNKFILIKSGNDLCLDCHKDMKEKISKNRFNHNAMRKQKGCLNCHDPHSSNRLKFLLIKDAPSLCLRCHKTDKPSFKKKHMNYDVRNSNCVSCHDPHGSDKKGILFNNVHKPVSENKCTECHEGPGSRTPLKVKAKGLELCRKCHKKMMDKTFSKNRVHWPLLDNTGCLNCHNPHGAGQKMLLNGPVVSVCGKCHSDTVELQKLSIENPKNKNLCKPVKTGNCIVCHDPHSSDNELLMVKSSSIELCGECHKWETHSTHPIGKKIIDQRNKNLSLDCYSCHRACGTGNYPAMLHFENTYDMCVQCHLNRRR